MLDLKKQYVYILLLVLGKILVKFFIGKQEEGGRYSIYIYSIYFINTPFIVLLFLVFLQHTEIMVTVVTFRLSRS